MSKLTENLWVDFDFFFTNSQEFHGSYSKVISKQIKHAKTLKNMHHISVQLPVNQ